MAKAKQQIDNPVIFDVIRKPVVTEKSTIQGQYGQISFRVATDATKPQIKEAVEKLFEVDVVSVNTINQRGKIKRFRGKLGKRSDYKKAVVTLKEGQTAELMGGV